MKEYHKKNNYVKLVCGYCGKTDYAHTNQYSFAKRLMHEHEGKCKHNPAAETCLTCRYVNCVFGKCIKCSITKKEQAQFRHMECWKPKVSLWRRIIELFSKEMGKNDQETIC